MQAIKHLIDLLEYDIWATQKSLSSIREHAEAPIKALSLLSHIISAQSIWYNRVIDHHEIPKPWAEFSLAEVLGKSKEINKKWVSLLEKLNETDLDKNITYKNTRGEEFNNNIRDIITHVINHSTYHRAQIAALIKQSGGKPAVTDYIAFKRLDFKG